MRMDMYLKKEKENIEKKKRNQERQSKRRKNA